MSKTNLIGLMTISAGIGAFYLIFKQLSHSKYKGNQPEEKEFLTIEMTRKITQEIKYQVLSLCMTFADQMDKKHLSSLYPEQFERLRQKLKNSITLLYQNKQALILGKYQVQKQLYGDSLRHYENDPQISSMKTAIMDMLEAVIQGKMPDISVPQEALNHMQADLIAETHRELVGLISIKVWKIIMEHIKDDPSFNPLNDQHFKNAVRKVGVYDLKFNFLVEKGFKIEWGSPNQTFFKIIQNIKIENKEFKQKISAIELSYQQMINKISTTPSDLNEEQILKLINQEILRLEVINQLEKSNIDHI